jgi:hypothetical protein
VKRFVAAYAIPLCLILLAVAILYDPPSPREGSGQAVRSLAMHYGVSEEKVLQVAAVLGVPPDDLTRFGDSPFPYNYFVAQFAEITAQKGQVTKQDTERIIRGYEIHCELYPWPTYVRRTVAITNWTGPGSRNCVSDKAPSDDFRIRNHIIPNRTEPNTSL